MTGTEMMINSLLKSLGVKPEMFTEAGNSVKKIAQTIAAVHQQNEEILRRLGAIEEHLGIAEKKYQTQVRSDLLLEESVHGGS
jgi:hypothetical protein